MPGGREKDGWMWYTCGPFDQLADHTRPPSLGFFGYANSNYRDYIIGTPDTTQANRFTEELEQLGFTEAGLRPEGHTYRNEAYPRLEVLRLEKRSTSVEYKRKEDTPDPRAEPIDTTACEPQETLKEARALGYHRVEYIPKLYWVFKVHVPTPHLSIRPSEEHGHFFLDFPVYGAVGEFVIRDLSGTEVRHSVNQYQRTELDLSDLSSGVYYLTLRSKWGSFSRTFMKN